MLLTELAERLTRVLEAHGDRHVYVEDPDTGFLSAPAWYELRPGQEVVTPSRIGGEVHLSGPALVLGVVIVELPVDLAEVAV